MWRLIKAEFIYNKTALVLVFLCSTPFIVYFHTWKNSNREMSIILMMAGIFLSTGIASSILLGNLGTKKKEKRERIHILLPIPIKRIGIARVTLPIIFWIGMVIIFVMLVLITRPYSLDVKMIQQLFALNGLVLIINGSAFINQDLIFYFQERYHRVMLWITYFIFIIIISIFFNIWLFPYYYKFLRFFQDFRKFLFFNFWGVFYLNMLGIGLTILSIYSYIKRKSYIE